MKIEKNLFDKNVFIFCFTIVLFKWFISFKLFNNEDLLNKILFDVEDIYYFPFILNLLDFNFSPDYLKEVQSNNLIPIPIYSILFHAIFFQMFGVFSFLLLEFIFLYLFLTINLKIFIKSNFNYYSAFLISGIIFILPIVLGNLQVFEINLNNVQNLFSFRFPRPLVTSCYFFWGIYLAHVYYHTKEFSLKNHIYTGICFSLIFVSYYYNFINLFLLFLFILINKIINENNYIIKNYSKIIVSIIIFLILIIPFLLIYNFSENDFSTMIGVIDLNFRLKKDLIIYFLTKIFTLKFISVFFLITYLRFLLLKSNKTNKNKGINFFYYLYIATIISPFFFTIVSPSISEIYHFLNWIVIISFFLIIVYFFFFIKIYLDRLKLKNIKILSSTIAFFLILFFLIVNYNHLINNQNFKQRSDYQNLQEFIFLNNQKLKSLLSFSIRPQVLWMFNDKKEFNSIESSVSSLNFRQLELNFVQNLKFLNISSSEFLKIISNQKGSWRYDNKYLKYISWYRYQANSLKTFNKTKDFKNDELEFINNSSPTRTQQIIIPQFEIIRLKKLFNNYELDIDYTKPDLIILNKDSLINQFASIDRDFYCKLDDYKTLEVYILKEISMCK